MNFTYKCVKKKLVSQLVCSTRQESPPMVRRVTVLSIDGHINPTNNNIRRRTIINWVWGGMQNRNDDNKEKPI